MEGRREQSNSYACVRSLFSKTLRQAVHCPIALPSRESPELTNQKVWSSKVQFSLIKLSSSGLKSFGFRRGEVLAVAPFGSTDCRGQLMSTTEKCSKLKILRTGDPRSSFQIHEPKEILKRFGRPKRLLSSSSKAAKCSEVNVLNRVMYLTPGAFCPRATAGCLAVCLGHTSGRMVMPTSTRARDRRTALYKMDQEHFLRILRNDLWELKEEANWRGMTPAVRLNGTSDIPWERLHPELLEEFDDIQFFDYTKLPRRMWRFLDGKMRCGSWPSNYHLTFSMSEENEDESFDLLDARANVAIVFWPRLPKNWSGYRVIDGDKHDARFLDPNGLIVGLRAKGIAREDLSGFVVHTETKR